MAKGGGGSRGGGGGGGGGGGSGSLNSLDKFEPAAEKALQELIDNSKNSQATGVFIADLRDKLGDKASREAFDKNLKAMMAKGTIETMTGGIESSRVGRVNDGGITTELGGVRQSVRFTDNSSDAAAARRGNSTPSSKTASASSSTSTPSARTARSQKSSVESKFLPGQAANIAKSQAVLRDKNSTPEQRAIAVRKITANVNTGKRN